MTDDGLYPDLNEATYHADKGSVSASGLKLMLKAPALYRWRQDHAEPPRDHFDVGTACHSKVLGVGAPTVVIDAKSKQVKAWTEGADKARAEGKTPLLRKEADAVNAMAEAVLAHATARRILTGGQSELSAFWTDLSWGIQRRARFDHAKNRIIGDLKTTASANPDKLAKTVVDYGYDLSAAQYIDVANGLDMDVTAFALVFVEKEPPHMVTVVDLDDDFLDRGRALCAVALERYRDCLAADVWPAYVEPDQFLTLTPPRWAPYPTGVTA